MYVDDDNHLIIHISAVDFNILTGTALFIFIVFDIIELVITKNPSIIRQLAKHIILLYNQISILYTMIYEKSFGGFTLSIPLLPILFQVPASDTDIISNCYIDLEVIATYFYIDTFIGIPYKRSETNTFKVNFLLKPTNTKKSMINGVNSV